VIGLAGALLAAAAFGIVRAAAPGGPLGRLGDGVRRGAERLRR
jgi:hypothetical protein